MSLVVLRSWSDGQPPKIRGIAPPDSDDKNEVVVPDHQGRFVTEELPKPGIVTPSSKVGMMRERFNNKSATLPASPSDPRYNPRVAKYWNRKSLPSPGNSSGPNSLSSNSLSPSPTHPHRPRRNTDLEDHGQRPDKTNLSRESSLQSLQTDPDSSPSSPVGGINSRYKSLGPELAATIPKRQIIRDTWVRDSYSVFRKTELSKSTPTLNLVVSPDEDQSQDDEDQDEERRLSELESERVRSNILTTLGKGNPLSKSTGSIVTAASAGSEDKDKSWRDSVYGAEFEAKFGDKPASVVGVIKKESPNSKQLPTQNAEPPPRPNSFYSTAASPPPYRRPGQQGSSPVDKETEVLRRVKREAKKAIRSVSFELDSYLHRKPELFAFADSEFPVHRAVHSEKPSAQAETPESDPERSHPKSKTNFETTNKSVESENFEDDIDLELDALRGESSESERESMIFNPATAPAPNKSGQGDKKEEQGEEDNDKNMHLNFRKASASFELPSVEETRRESNRNSHGHGNKHGSARAQVPVQCVNRHVMVPAKPPVIPVPAPVKPPELMTNGDDEHFSYDRNNVNVNGNGKTDHLRRKNFCDELLNDVVLQVPPPPSPIVMNQGTSSPSNNAAALLQENHDGIIIFDEEDEFEESETDSVALSERENSFEYLSVFQNVKVGSPTENKTRPSEPVQIIGLDLGSTFSRHCSMDKSTGVVQTGDAFRSLVTSDGMAQGVKAIYHSMATKSKLIYKWRARQSFPYDPYDDEDNSSILEILFKHYDQLLGLRREPTVARRPSDLRPPSPDAGGDDGEKSVQWNVSVHSAMEKKVVREAAFSSGLVKSMDELRLVNESTGAGVTAYQFLKAKNPSTPLQNYPKKRGVKTFLSMNVGSTYIHTSGYEYSSDGKLHLIETGESQTYQSPEAQFTDLFARVFSREFLLKYESRFTPSWVQILIRFEKMKDNYVDFDSECYLFLPISFFLEFFKCTGIQVPECIEDNTHEGIAWDNNGAIRFTKDLMDDWLEPTLNSTKARMKMRNYDAIVLSGGGANETLRKQLQHLASPSVQVYLLDNPEKAVVQGLVNLDSVHLTLKSPFSIGVGVMTPFDESVHPPEKCVTRSGKKWCSDVWDNLIRKGQPMTMGEVVLKRTYVGAQPGQNVLVLPIFKSDLEEPKLVTSPSVEKCCELRFEINKEKSWREVQLVIKCADRELSILATGNDGDISHVVIDF